MVTDGTSRDVFLAEMYKAMWDNINRHIGVVWHSVTVLAGAFAVFGLVEKGVVPIDFATALVVIISTWQLAHVFDASYWVNRNLLIIRNIECQFLNRDDLQQIHYYFVRQRDNKMIDHFRIQFALGIVVPILTLIYHAHKQGLPAHFATLAETAKALPYAAFVVGAIFVLLVRDTHNGSYAKLRKESPGPTIVTDGET